MHENRHFLSYRKRRHDAENHVHICALRHSGESCKMASNHRVTDLEKIPVESPRMKLRCHFQQLGLCLFSPCCFISLEPCYGCGVSVFLVLCTCFYNRLDLIREPAFYWVFYFPNLSLFVSSYVKMKVLFVLVQQTSDFVASLGEGLGLGQLPVLAIHCFCLGLPFCFSSYIVHLRCTSEWSSLDV